MGTVNTGERSETKTRRHTRGKYWNAYITCSYDLVKKDSRQVVQGEGELDNQVLHLTVAGGDQVIAWTL